MNLIVIGAGEVGKFIATTLSHSENDVVVVDQKFNILDTLKDKNELMTVHGNGAMVNILKKAGIQKADMLVAVTNSSESNILACEIAAKFNVPKKICRVSSMDYFSDEGFKPKDLGIDQVVIPGASCTENIMDVIKNPDVKEFVRLDCSNSCIANFLLKPGSFFVGKQLIDFADDELMNKSRVCAIRRRGNLIIPRGMTRFYMYDEVYIAGEASTVQEIIKKATPSEPFKVEKVIISGITQLSIILSKALYAEKIPFTVIEESEALINSMSDHLARNSFIIQGDPTDPNILEEAGIDTCDVYISTVDDEINVLSSLLAKKRGAKKVFAVTNKPEYMQIIAGMNQIDAIFSTRISTVNAMLHHIRGENLIVGSILTRINAEVLEFAIQTKSYLKGKKIEEIPWPKNTMVAMVFRDKKIRSAIGSLTIEFGDRVIIFADVKSVSEVEKLFNRSKIF